MKKKYINPIFTKYEVSLDDTIAVASVNLGTDDSPYTPSIDDFNNDGTEIKWQGDL